MQANGRTMRQGVASSLRGSHARAANAPARAREVRYGGTPLRVRACLLTLHALPRPARVANRVRAAFGPKARATNPDAHANALARQGAPAPVPPLRVYGAAPRHTTPRGSSACMQGRRTRHVAARAEGGGAKLNTDQFFDVGAIDGMVFDIDGTLVDSDPFHHQAFQELLQPTGFNGARARSACACCYAAMRQTACVRCVPLVAPRRSVQPAAVRASAPSARARRLACVAACRRRADHARVLRQQDLRRPHADARGGVLPRLGQAETGRIQRAQGGALPRARRGQCASEFRISPNLRTRVRACSLCPLSLRHR